MLLRKLYCASIFRNKRSRKSFIRVATGDDIEGTRERRVESAEAEKALSIFELTAKSTVLRVLGYYHGCRNSGIIRPTAFYVVSEGAIRRARLSLKPTSGYPPWPPEVNEAHHDVAIDSRAAAEKWVQILDASGRIDIPAMCCYYVYRELILLATMPDAESGIANKIKTRFGKLKKLKTADPSKVVDILDLIDYGCERLGPPH